MEQSLRSAAARIFMWIVLNTLENYKDMLFGPMMLTNRSNLKIEDIDLWISDYGSLTVAIYPKSEAYKHAISTNCTARHLNTIAEKHSIEKKYKLYWGTTAPTNSTEDEMTLRPCEVIPERVKELTRGNTVILHLEQTDLTHSTDRIIIGPLGISALYLTPQYTKNVIERARSKYETYCSDLTYNFARLANPTLVVNRNADREIHEREMGRKQSSREEIIEERRRKRLLFVAGEKHRTRGYKSTGFNPMGASDKRLSKGMCKAGIQEMQGNNHMQDAMPSKSIPDSVGNK